MRESDLSPNKWQLLSKITSPDEGVVKTTAVIDIDGVGCLVNVSTRTENGSALSEALTFIPGVKLTFLKRIPDLVAIPPVVVP
jgi:hypothetical protein